MSDPFADVTLEMDGPWRPIDSAPKDGTWILANCGYPLPDVLCWGHYDLPDAWSDGERAYSPTHWMPIPEPPK